MTTWIQCLRQAGARNGLADRWIFAVMSASWWARGLQGQPIGVLTAWNGIVTALRACGPPSVAKGMTKISYNGYRFPSEIIEQAIWLYLRFTLSFRDVEDLLAEPGISTSSSTTDRPISSPNALTPASTPASWWRRKVEGQLVFNGAFRIRPSLCARGPSAAPSRQRRSQAGA